MLEILKCSHSRYVIDAVTGIQPSEKKSKQKK